MNIVYENNNGEGEWCVTIDDVNIPQFGYYLFKNLVSMIPVVFNPTSMNSWVAENN